MELGAVRAPALETLLAEEVQAWRDELDWDFQPSANLVRRYVDLGGLAGYALLAQGQAVGYSYYVSEERKGVVGDLYVMEAFRQGNSETQLLGAVLEALVRGCRVRRVESQLMLMSAAPGGNFPQPRHLKIFERRLMMIEASKIASLPARSPAGVVLQPWGERWQEEAARLIATAYRGHIDAEVNEQYRSPAGARRFLQNIVQYPGCGTFFGPASWLAFETGSGRLCGLCLASAVASDVGHITQLCVTPPVRGRGLGYELIRRSLNSLAAAGMRRISLTVTSANRPAVELYEAMGFVTRRRFAALVWDGF